MLEGRKRKATRESRVDLSGKNLEGGSSERKDTRADATAMSIRFDLGIWRPGGQIRGACTERGRGREVCDKKLADGMGCVYACSRE